MKLIKLIHEPVKRMLSQPSKIDGRLWVLISLLSYFSFLFVANFFIPYYKVWEKLGVSAGHRRIFMDLGGVLRGFECTRLGYDPLLKTSCMGSVIYPRLWWKFTFLGLDTSHLVVLGVLSAIAFYLITFAIIGRLNLYEGILYSLILCSPPIMLLIERGNIDIIIYVMSFLTLMMAQSRHLYVRILGYIWLLIPTFLKILSVFSLTVILKETRKTFILCFLPLLTISVIYLYNIKSAISTAKEYFEITNWNSGGPEVWNLWGYEILLNNLTSHFFFNYLSIRKLHFVTFPLILIGLATLAFLIVTQVIPIIFQDIMNSNPLSKREVLPSEKIITESKALDGFRIGSSFYLGTFIATISVDYKLAFLIFTIPQMILWIKQEHSRLSTPSSLALIGIIFTLYISPFFASSLLDELLNYYLWFYFIYAFILTLPNWIKLSIRNLIPAKMLA